ncbi:hypothetical protein [Haloglomus litoreum]|uniref:hypothetical protein n=1 Tax=Haloglomus litoreum TaxID=3034026 RepID=UPI0023E801F8|nr:hypothetical protein [Haloglomus sp. DT116]
MVGIPEVMVGVGSIYITAAAFLWRETRNLRKEYGEDYDDMMTYRASQFRSELHDIVTDVLQDVNMAEYQGTDEDDLEVMDAMESIDRTQLTEVEEALREYDRPPELVSTTQDEYGTTTNNLLFAGGSALIMAVGSVLANGNSEQGIQIILGAFLVVGTITAVNSFRAARSAEKEVNEAVRDYTEDY